MRWLSLFVGAIFTAAAGAHDERATSASSVTKAPVMPVIRAAPDFSLVNVEGKPVQLSSLRGRPVLVAFIYTGCKTACPLLTARMARLQQKLAKARADAVLVSVSVDPQRDDAATLARFAEG
jgi:protein SCO1/2